MGMSPRLDLLPTNRLLLPLALIGCTIGRTSVSTAQSAREYPRCDSVPETRLFPNQSLEGLEGRYRLVLVKTDGWRKPNGTFTGLLYLWRTSSRDSSANGARPLREDSTRTMYFGTIDIDLDSAEWFMEFRWPKPINPTRDSVDPIHPPMVGFAFRGVDEIGPWLWFMLGVGNRGNHRDSGGSLDGLGVGLTVERVDTRGLFGNWGPFGIAKTGSGYFCAYRDSSN